MAKLASVRILKSVRGGYSCFIGRSQAENNIDVFNAKVWLAKQVIAGNPVSPSSYFSAADVEKYKALV